MTNTLGIRTTLAALIVAAGIAAPSTALAAGPVVSNAHVTLRGQVAIPDSADAVTLSGVVHVVTRVVPVEDEFLITVYVNLPANVSAVGPQELRFIAHGASKHADVHPITAGALIPCIMPGFTLLLDDPDGKGIKPIDFSLQLYLGFSETGELLSGVADTDLGSR